MINSFEAFELSEDKFHTSQNGQKLYAGADEYTLDDFGATDINKYYAIFTYDNVPNYSEPIILEYIPK
jgi:hypothetical protein